MQMAGAESNHGRLSNTASASRFDLIQWNPIQHCRHLAFDGVSPRRLGFLRSGFLYSRNVLIDLLRLEANESQFR